MTRRTLLSLTALTGFVVLAFGSAGDPSPVSVSSELSGPLTLDQEATLTLQVQNDGESDFEVTSLVVDSDLARSWTIEQTIPATTAESTTGMAGDISLQTDPFVVPAKSRADVTIRFTPRVGGSRSGTVSVCGGGTCPSSSVSSVLPGETEDLIAWDVSVSDVTVGETVPLVVTFENRGTRDDGLVSITLKEDLLARVKEVGVEPSAALVEESVLGGVDYEYDMPLPPGTTTITFQLEGTSAGSVSDYINICVDSHMLCGQPNIAFQVR